MTSLEHLPSPRRPLACNPCRQRKIGCDRLQPHCAVCQRSGFQCSYPSRTRIRRATRAARNTELITRLNRLEQVIGDLGDLDRSSQVRTEERNLDGNLCLQNGAEPNGGAQPGSDNSTPSQVNIQRTDDSASSNPGSRANSYPVQSVWKTLSAQIGDILDLAGQSSDEDDDSYPSPTPLHNEPPRSGFVLGSNPRATTSYSFHPSPLHASLLLELYIHNVDPMAKILHVPTLRDMVIAAASQPSQIQRDLGREALVFSIYFAAVVSVDDVQCLAQFSESKAAMTGRFRTASERALAQAGFLESIELTTLQAFVIFVTSVRCLDPGQLAWNLTGLIVRIARSIGLHRDGAGTKNSRFQTEMRRRLWWQSSSHDLRAAQDRGSEPLILANSFDTQLPLNINDEDFNQQTVGTMAERIGGTDMMFCLIQYEVISLWREIGFTHSFSGHSSDGPPTQTHSLQEKEKLIDQLRHKFESKYLAHCNMQVPLFWVAATVSRLIINWLRMAALSPFLTTPFLSTVSDAAPFAPILEDAFKTAVCVLEDVSLLEENEYAAGWRWYFGLWCQWHALAVSLAVLCTGTTSPTVGRAWSIIDKMFDHFGERVADTARGVLWRPIKRLHAKAQQMRRKSAKHIILGQYSTSDTQILYGDGALWDLETGHSSATDPSLRDYAALPATLSNLSGSLDATSGGNTSIGASTDVNLDDWIDWNEFVQYTQDINGTMATDSSNQSYPTPAFWMW